MRFTISILILCLSFHYTISPTTIHGRSVNIADGDTFTLLDDNNTQHRIRIEGIDAPERGQAFSNKSREYLAKMIVGKRLTVTYTEKDRYGRILGKVTTDSVHDVNLRMIQSGMAWHYSYYNSEKEYADAEKEARKNKVGLWFDNDPTTVQRNYPIGSVDLNRNHSSDVLV